MKFTTQQARREAQKFLGLFGFWQQHIPHLSQVLSPLQKVTQYYLLRKENVSKSFSVQFSCSVMSDSLWPHGLQHTRLPCLSPSPRACSNSCPLSWWCHPTISHSVVPFSSCLQSLLASDFSGESVLCIRWPKYWSFSFSISPHNEYSGLISFKIDWFDLLAVQGILKSLLQHHSSKTSILLNI